MKERPILFSGPMVRALLDGRKTQTRRVVRWPEIPARHDPDYDAHVIVDGWPWLYVTPGDGRNLERRLACPYGAPGDRLWVKETFAYVEHRQNYECGGDDTFYQWDAEMYGKPAPEHLKLDPRTQSGAACLCFAADGEDENPAELYPLTDLKGKVVRKAEIHWRPSIFMHRWASRLTLEIVSVRVERLNDISEADALAEGISTDPTTIRAANYKPVNAYRSLWESINGPGSWALNPWVWVVEFRRIEMTERGSAEMAPAPALAGASPERGSERERVNLGGCPQPRAPK